MIRPVVLVWIGLAAVVAVSLFLVKYKVQDLDEQLATIESDKLAAQQSIHVLEAEWAYLNRPEILESLSAKYLQLNPTEAKQLIVFDPKKLTSNPDLGATR